MEMIREYGTEQGQEAFKSGAERLWNSRVSAQLRNTR